MEPSFQFPTNCTEQLHTFSKCLQCLQFDCIRHCKGTLNEHSKLRKGDVESVCETFTAVKHGPIYRSGIGSGSGSS